MEDLQRLRRFILLLILIYLPILIHLPSSNAGIIVERRMIRAAGLRSTQRSLISGHRAIPTQSSYTNNKQRNNCRNGLNCTTPFPALENHGNETRSRQNETVLQKILDEYNPSLLCLDYRVPFPYIIKYDPNTQICCNGLYNLTKPTQTCCNGDIIDTESEVCCTDQHFEINSAIGCCEDTVYYTNDTICCNGTLAPKTKYSVCCGDRVISNLTEICCDGSAHVKDSHDGECCGTSVYNSIEQLCCDGVVRSRHGPNGDYEQCCGTDSYDPKCHTCSSNGTVEPIQHSSANGTCCHGDFRERGGIKYCCENGTNGKRCWRIFDNFVPASSERNTDYIAISIVASSGCILVIVLVGACSIIKKKQNWLMIHKNGYNGEENPMLSANSVVTRSTGITCTSNTDLDEKPRCSSLHLSRTDVSMLVDLSNDTEEFSDNADEQLHNNNNNRQRDPIITYIDHYVTDDVMHVPSDRELRDLFNKISKPKDNGLYINDIADYAKDIACQTTTKDNACNRRTIFGKPFSQSSILDAKQSVFKMAHSEVSVQLPITTLKDPVEIHGSSFENIGLVHEKIAIPDDEIIISPVVEYLLTGHTALDDHAMVTIPFIGGVDKLNVWKFNSDDGMQTKVKPYEVLLKSRENTDIPLYYEIEGNSVKVFTKSFSGFFITTKTHNRDRYLHLRSFLFGSHKRINRRHEARLMMYVADEIMIFEDYKKVMYDREALEGRYILKEQSLYLTEKVREEDILRATLLLGDVEARTWQHEKHPRTGEPVYPVTQDIKFEEIVQKCPDCPDCHYRHKTVPFCIEWYLRTSPANQAYPTDIFKCFVDVECIKLDTNESKQNVIIVDELQLRPEDRYPDMESSEANRLSDLKRYLIGLEDGNQRKFVEKMQEKYQCKSTEISGIFTDLIGKMKTVGIYEAVVNVLHSTRMYREVDALQKTGILEDKYFPKPKQSVGVDQAEGYRNTYENSLPRPPTNNALTHTNTYFVDSGMFNINHEYSNNSTNMANLLNHTYSHRHDVECPGECRNELGSDLPAYSYPRDQDVNRNGIAGYQETHISEEESIPIEELTHLKQPVPIQEDACTEETLLKSSCSDSEEDI